MTAWIAIDWGSSNLRAWRMDGAQVTDEAAAAVGAITLDPPQFEPALLDVVGPWLVERLSACRREGPPLTWSSFSLSLERLVADHTVAVLADGLRGARHVDRVAV